MLVLTRKIGESFFIGEQADITVKVLTNDGINIRIGIEAPKEILIAREELYKKSKPKSTLDGMV